ncbi:MAG: DUF4249 family protein [Saprospiraceae bacterium]|nr:DUF4249 family protein [Saprospiraceae bacterium]
MKKYFSYILLLVVVGMASCVSRIDIPENEESKLFISLEMLAGDTKIVADLNTTNNLNGTFPIQNPSDAIIVIKEENIGGSDVAVERTLEYDEVIGKYQTEDTDGFLKTGFTYFLEAQIDNSTYKKITAETKVPNSITIDDFELLSEEIVQDIDGNDVWQGTIGISLMDANKSGYGHLVLYGFLSTKEISLMGEEIIVFGTESRPFELIEVVQGQTAITDIIHRDGLFINLGDLNNDYLEITLRSPFPITQPNQVTDHIHTEMISVSAEHYDYHIAYHNIKSSQNDIFGEKALFRSNIKDGLGLFSSCSRSTTILELRK